MDDLKLFENQKKNQNMEAVHIFSEDIGMLFSIQRCNFED